MRLRTCVLFVALLAIAACRGEHTITGSYGSGTLSGRVVVTGMQNSSPAGVQVSVRGTGMTTTLGQDGAFAFVNVPENAQLVFRRADGIDASLDVSSQSGFVTVELSGSNASANGGRRRSASRGTNEGKVYEFEGVVRSASAAELVVYTSKKTEVTIALDAATIVRKGKEIVDASTLAPDTRVHVKARQADDLYTAIVVIVQNPADDEEGGGGGQPPERKEYEGVVRSASATELVIFDSHKEEVTFVLNGDTVIRKGGTALTPADLKADDRVHVKASTAVDGTKTALEVIVQQQKSKS